MNMVRPSAATTLSSELCHNRVVNHVVVSTAQDCLCVPVDRLIPNRKDGKRNIVCGFGRCFVVGGK